MPKSRKAAGLSQQVGSGHMAVGSRDGSFPRTAQSGVTLGRVCLPRHKVTLPRAGACKEHDVVWVPLGPVQIPPSIAAMEGKEKGNFAHGQKHGIVCLASRVLSEWPAGSR